MTDILTPAPAEEMLADINRRLHEMATAANNDIVREEARSREWCSDRWRRMNDETAPMRAQRDAMLKALTNTMPMPVLSLPVHEPWCADGHREAVCTCGAT